jgi:molybdenum cofactor cytidylyltransferase
MRIGAIILAAGASRRLGRAKQLVAYEGETLLARVVRLVREADLMRTVVVLGAEHEAIAATVDLSSVCVVWNEKWAQGIASSIHAGLRALEEMSGDADGTLILTCDQPRLTMGHLRALIAAFDARGGWELYALCGDKGARVLLKEAGDAVVRVDFPGGEVDVDTSEDLAALE